MLTGGMGCGITLGARKSVSPGINVHRDGNETPRFVGGVLDGVAVFPILLALPTRTDQYRNHKQNDTNDHHYVEDPIVI